MYYSEHERLEQMEGLLERFAYISIVSDFLIAISTYFVFQNISFSKNFLLLSDYLDLIEVVIASVILVLIVTLRYYKRTISRLHLFIIRSRYRGDTWIFGAPA
ncbi:MAG: hypothetical protein KGH72_00325 [Candidatus Micrarchaeota archaeon]|nr:hypothetical protein [Candidatus Micrarchaeota archaeon]